MITAWIGGICMLLLVLFQILLTLGFPLGEYAMGGKYKVFPPKMRIFSGIAAVILTLAAILILSLGGILDLDVSAPFFRYAAYGFGGYLCLNTIMNLFSFSKKEKYTMTPLSAIVAFCLIYTAYHSTSY